MKLAALGLREDDEFRMTFSKWRGRDGGYGTGGGGGNDGYCEPCRPDGGFWAAAARAARYCSSAAASWNSRGGI